MKGVVGEWSNLARMFSSNVNKGIVISLSPGLQLTLCHSTLCGSPLHSNRDQTFIPIIANPL
jgi:hypothetical protein